MLAIRTAASLSALTLFVHPARAQPVEELVTVAVTTVGVDLGSGLPIALLRDREWGQTVPIWIGSEEAQAIARVLEGVVLPRPMTHDLLASVIRQMGGAVEEVAVHAMDAAGETFLARIRVRVGSGSAAETRDIDSRPSDALALALRTGAAVRVAPALIRAAPEVDFLVIDAGAEVVRILGMTLAHATPERRRQFSLPTPDGVVVLQVSEALAELGLRRGDLLVDVNAEVPSSPMAVLEALEQSRPTDPVRIVYIRDGADSLLVIPPGRLQRPPGRGREG